MASTPRFRLSSNTDMKWGRKANSDGQSKRSFFAHNPITVRYASNGPPLPAKFFPLFAVAVSFYLPYTNQLSHTKLIYLPCPEDFLFHRQCEG